MATIRSRWLARGAGVVVAMLAACSSKEEPAKKERPVIVAVQDAAGATGSAAGSGAGSAGDVAGAGSAGAGSAGDAAGAAGEAPPVRRMFIPRIPDAETFEAYSKEIGNERFAKFVIDLKTDAVYYFDV